MIPAAFSVKTVGVSFATDYPDSLFALAKSYGQLPAGAQGEASLVRRADNEFDTHAIEVLACGRHVGWIPAGLAQRLAPAMDMGAQYRIVHVEVQTHPDHPERPGLLLDIAKVDIHA